MAFEECGWSAEEVADDLGYLLTGKYYRTFGDAIRVRPDADGSITIEGSVEADKISEIVKVEADDVRSLKGIRTIDQREGVVVVGLHEPAEPKMYPVADGREVKCLLFRSGS